MSKYYYQGNQRVAIRKGTDFFLLLADHLGSSSVSYNTSTHLAVRERYKPWGDLRDGTNHMPTNYTYTGQYSYTADFGLMFYNARWYDPSLGRFAQADTVIPSTRNPGAWDRYAAMLNNPVRNTDPTGHTVYSDDGHVPDDTATWLRKQTQGQFGITFSNEGSKDWGVDNLRLVYQSLCNINAVLSGNLKSFIGEATFKLGEHVRPEGDRSVYDGVTNGSNITFNTMGNAVIYQMNIYHEFGHLINNASGGKFFSDLDKIESTKNPSFIDEGGFIDTKALKGLYVSDPNHGYAEALQHPGTDRSEHWADIFGNYVAGNINLDRNAGRDMNTFITGELFPTPLYIGPSSRAYIR